MAVIATVLALLVLCPSRSEGDVIGVTTTSKLPHSTFLDVSNKFHVAWDFDDQDITFEVSVETLGYVGLGFSPNGDMTGSDIVVGWVDDRTGVGRLSDRHAVSRSKPVVDKKTQDYKLLHSYQNRTHTVLRFTRKLQLCSEDDHHIKHETIRLIWAYHDADPSSEGDIQYHKTNRGNKNMYLLDPQRRTPSLPDNVIYYDFLNPQFEIPARETTYWCQAFPIPELDRKHHMIKVEPIIQPGHEAEVHHIILYACYQPVSNESMSRGHQCYNSNMPDDFHDCTSPFLTWAVGGTALYLPEHVGIPLGDVGGPNMFLMETHYDNPTLQVGLVDSSGLRVTLTSNLRKYDAGILQTGHSVARTHIIPPLSNRFTTSGICFPECLAQAMATHPKGIKVFANNLHTHLLGIAGRIRHFRNGIEQPLIGEDENYDFNYQVTRMMEKEIEIRPGDNLVVECDYNSSGRTTVTYGGLSTRSEMCLGFLFYYPKIALSKCQSLPTAEYLASFAGVKLGPDMPGWKLVQNIGSLVNFTDKSVRERFQKWASQKDVDGFRVHCSYGGYDYPIHGNVLPFPPKWQTLPPKTCSGFRADLTMLVFVVSIMTCCCF